ncbi:MAG: SAM-dependent methyltransferase [Pseudomonadota bacterium]
MISLPPPSSEAQAHSERLTEVLKQVIQQHGWISFAEFMHRALYEPGLGYYVSGSRKLGAEGDFITAPEISSAFSECLALQCQQVFDALDTRLILEFGAGSGAMAADILLTLEKNQQLPQSYYILEVSPDFQERQRQTLQEKCVHLLPLVSWLSELPKAFEGVVLANEVLDAMPVHCFEVQNGKKFERGVVSCGENFMWKTRLDPSLCWDDSSKGNDSLLLMDDGYVSEVCFAIKHWLKALYASMKRGVVLLIDYGFPEHEYYHPDRYQGTLMCHYRHHAHADPFIYLGLQDITAHVDFSAVARAADRCGFEVAGYTNQANFLMALGILSNTHHDLLNTRQQYTHAQAIKKLLLPSEMGELFKVIALAKKIKTPLLGFQLRNEIGRLY